MREVVQERKKQAWFNRVDDVIGIFSPVWGARRKLARIGLDRLSSYRAAAKDRTRKDWFPGGGSADEDLLDELDTLRERSRDLNRNNGFAKAITNTIVLNVIGKGIRPQSRIDAEVLGIAEEEADHLRIQAEDAWGIWIGESDAAERLMFAEVQELVVRQILENGEALIQPVRINAPYRHFYFALQLIEADRLGTPSNKRSDMTIREGIQVGEYGQPKFYWIKKTHPGDMREKGYRQDDYLQFPARDADGRRTIFHLYQQLRPGQSRGVPLMTSVMTFFRDLGRYVDAELFAASAAACIALFVKSANPYNAAMGRANTTDAAGKRVETLEPGMIEYLAAGEDISQFAPNRPTQAFDPFVQSMLHAIGAACDLPYELVTKDFTKTTYSSARAALLETRHMFETRQDWLVNRFLQPVWEMVLEEAYLRNEFDVSDFYGQKRLYTQARWIPHGWKWVDPESEVNSIEKALDNNLTTVADELAASGRDIEEVFKERALEKKWEKELGIEKPIKEAPQKVAMSVGDREIVDARK